MKKILLALIPFLLFSSLLVLEPPFFQWLELKSIDWRFVWRGELPTSGNIVVVAIDEKSVRLEGRWPWSRAHVAKLLDLLSKGDPTVIGLDIIFSESAPDDSILAASLKNNGKSILGYYFYNNAEELKKASISTAMVTKSFDNISALALPQHTGFNGPLITMNGVVSNLPTIADGALSQGFFNAVPDRDGVIRKTPLIARFRAENFASLTLKIFSQIKEGFDPIAIRDSQGILQGINIREDFIPTTEAGELWINYHGESAFPVYSATDVLSGVVDPSVFKGKTILVGATAVGIYDLRVTPFSPVTPGVFVQAETVETLNTREFLKANANTKLISLASLAVLALLTYLFIANGPILLGLVTTLTLFAGYVAGVYFLFTRGYLISFAYPMVQTVSIVFGITAYRSLTEEKEKRKIRKIFQAYLHPDVIEEIVRDPAKLKMGGEKIVCSVLFCDVRDFTSISEKIQPAELVEMMNEYFGPVTADIINLGGYIDKFIGDAVMALFGVPKATNDHALKAGLAALAIQRRAAELEPLFQKKYGIAAFRVGVGVHTGPVIMGNMGSSQRINYTAMGDAVNLASRLEGATKGLGAPILISQATYEAVGSRAEATYLDEISVKGKEEKIKVYGLKGIA